MTLKILAGPNNLRRFARAAARFAGLAGQGRK